MHVFFPSAPEGRAGRSAVVVRRVGRRRRDGRIEIDLHVRRASDQAAVILHVCAQAGSVGKAGWGWDGGGDGGVGLRGGAGASVGTCDCGRGSEGDCGREGRPPAGLLGGGGQNATAVASTTTKAVLGR